MVEPIPLPKGEVVDEITVRHVANGWIILLGGGHGSINEHTHIAATPEDLAKHVKAWASAQLT